MVKQEENELKKNIDEKVNDVSVSIVDSKHNLNYFKISEEVFNLAQISLDTSSNFFFMADCLCGLHIPDIFKASENSESFLYPKCGLEFEHRINLNRVSLIDNCNYNLVVEVYEGIKKFLDKDKNLNLVVLLANVQDLISSYCELEENFYKNFLVYSKMYLHKYGDNEATFIPVLKQLERTYHSYSRLPKLSKFHYTNLCTLPFEEYMLPNENLGFLFLLKIAYLLQLSVNPRFLSVMSSRLQRFFYVSSCTASKLAFAQNSGSSLRVSELNVLLENDVDLFKVS